MTAKDFIIVLFHRIDEELKNLEKHPQTKLYQGRSRPPRFSVLFERSRQSGILPPAGKRLSGFISTVARKNKTFSLVSRASEFNG